MESADYGELLDFVEYLLDWSKDHPIFVLTLANGNLRTLAQGQDFFFGDLVWLK